MRYQAHFDAQAWQNDYANSVDAEGPTTWDVTAFVENPPEWVSPGYFDGVKAGEEFIDTDDVFLGDDNAPAWVREWSGPFTISVEKVSETA